MRDRFVCRWDSGTFHTFQTGHVQQIKTHQKSCLGVRQGPASQWQILTCPPFRCGIFLPEVSPILPLSPKQAVRQQSAQYMQSLCTTKCVCRPQESQVCPAVPRDSTSRHQPDRNAYTIQRRHERSVQSSCLRNSPKLDRTNRHGDSANQSAFLGRESAWQLR